MRSLLLANVIVALAGAAALPGQQADSAPAPRASFIGRVISSVGDAPVRAADLRLMRVDSTRTVRLRQGTETVDIFVDTTRSRAGVSDSTGAFAVRRLAAGRYMLYIRRIGFQPLEGVLVVDSNAVGGTFVMQEVSHLLATVHVTETAVDRVKQRLDRVGFLGRSRSEGSGTFVDRSEILRRQPQTVADILATYGIHDGDFELDRMPVDYDFLRDYPADLVLGLEIYRHGRPIEFNMTRRGANMFSPGGLANASQVLVLIWTYIP